MIRRGPTTRLDVGFSASRTVSSVQLHPTPPFGSWRSLMSQVLRTLRPQTWSCERRNKFHSFSASFCSWISLTRVAKPRLSCFRNRCCCHPVITFGQNLQLYQSRVILLAVCPHYCEWKKCVLIINCRVVHHFLWRADRICFRRRRLFSLYFIVHTRRTNAIMLRV